MISAMEKKILNKAHERLFIIAIIFFSLFAVLIRYLLRDFVSYDMRDFLLPWYEQIKSSGGIYSLNEQVGDYNMPYQFLISLMTYVPLKAVYLYKILSCVFDFILAGSCAIVVYGFSKNSKATMLIYVTILFTPTIFLNSAAWGQCDSIYTAFIVLSFGALKNDKFFTSFLFLGIAFAFKLQTVLILPFYLFVYFQKKRFSIFYFALVPFVMCVMSIPNIIAGRNLSEVFTLYVNQTNTYRAMFLNYPSFWSLFSTSDFFETYDMFRNIGLIFTIFVLATIMLYWIKEKIQLSSENMLYMAFLVMYTCVLFLPSMHERYSYPYDVFALIIACINPKKILMPTLVLVCISLNTYGHYLLNGAINLQILTFLNIIVYCVFMFTLIKRMKKAQN